MPFSQRAVAGTILTRAYGGGQALSPGSELMLDVMRRRNDLWNALVALERENDDAIERILAEDPTYADLEVGSKDYRARWRAYRLSDEGKANESALLAAARAECKQHGLNWMNYEDVLLDWLTARRKLGAGPHTPRGTKEDQKHARWVLRFHSWRRVPGKILARWQHGLPVATAFAGTDTRLRIDRIRMNFDGSEYVVCHVRAASDERRNPVWVSLPIRLHRPLPESTLIRAVSLHREIVGTRDWLSVRFVLEAPEPACWQRWPDAPRHGAVAVDLCWRHLEGEMRAGYWVGGDGQQGQIALPDHLFFDRMQKAEHLQSVRDENFNRARANLVAFLGTLDQETWLHRETRYLADWREPDRLAALVWRWKDERIAGDEQIFPLLWAWRQRELHLHRYQDGMLRGAENYRRNEYRKVAADLARRYGTLVLEDFDLRQMARERTKDEKAQMSDRDRALDDVRRYQRKIVAPSLLRLALEQTFRREGLAVRVVDPQYTTLRCHVCGHVETAETFDRAVELRHCCSACSVEWDQDENACIWLLRGGAVEKDDASQTSNS